MKDIKRYCDNCKKETIFYMKVQVVNRNHKVESTRSYDKCKNCIIKIYPEFEYEKRRGLQQ